jgi:hypothetical protein
VGKGEGESGLHVGKNEKSDVYQCKKSQNDHVPVVEPDAVILKPYLIKSAAVPNEEKPPVYLQ